MNSVSRLLRWSSTSRRWAVLGGVLALFVAGYAWMLGITAGGLDDYEACELHTAWNETPELVVRREVPPIQVTCVFSDGSTIALAPAWVNPVLFLAAGLGVFLLITSYANVLVDAWRGPASS